MNIGIIANTASNSKSTEMQRAACAAVGVSDLM
jgi:hypothetical protein